MSKKVVTILFQVVFVIGLLLISMRFGDRRMHANTNNDIFAIVGGLMSFVSIIAFVILSLQKNKR
jgi:hypothetical protein